MGLFEAINGESGTGRRARLGNTIVAGKTGTAQNPQGRTHAWFCGFAPYNNPKVCVVVFLEHGGRGGVEPAAIARDIFIEAMNKGYLQ
jgi:cell division protein FtsI/penicillin-binding protein 2